MRHELTAVVTGGNRGIGSGVVRQLVDRNYTVLLGSRDFDAGDGTAHTISQATGGEVEAVQLDVTAQESVDAVAEVVAERWGRLDVLVNNAGGYYDDWQRVENADLDTVRSAIDVNLLGTWRVIDGLLPCLRKGTRRRIVNVSSVGGILATMQPDHPAYRVSKAGLNALTKMFAVELQPERILVNAVCPGWTATEMGEWKGHSIGIGAGHVLAAVDIDDDGPTGVFFNQGKVESW
jgi:NAD(P)-dependent dehydrogenase (short-subunit alcohol dehydrogenase family)